MLHVIDSVEPCIRAQYQSQLLGILGIDKVCCSYFSLCQILVYFVLNVESGRIMCNVSSIMILSVLTGQSRGLQSAHPGYSIECPLSPSQ